jgi:hypothetical protein
MQTALVTQIIASRGVAHDLLDLLDTVIFPPVFLRQVTLVHDQLPGRSHSDVPAVLLRRNNRQMLAIGHAALAEIDPVQRPQIVRAKARLGGPSGCG